MHQAVLLEEDVVTFAGWSTTVSVGGERGANIIREADAGLKILLKRPIRDLLRRVPRFQVRACFDWSTPCYSAHALMQIKKNCCRSWMTAPPCMYSMVRNVGNAGLYVPRRAVQGMARAFHRQRHTYKSASCSAIYETVCCHRDRWPLTYPPSRRP